MYQAHFGLTAPLAAPGIARDARVYADSGAYRLVPLRLGNALARGNAAVLLSGPAGTGKTTLAAHAIRTHATRLALGWIAHAPGRPHDLLEQLLAGFGLAPGNTSRAELLSTWQEFLNEMAATETSVCVLVEHADALGPGVLRALESLTAADPSGCPGANLILMSRTSLAERLRRPGLEGLAQRVSANLRLEPLDAAETHAYVDFALAACGGRLEHIVDDAAIDALHACSGGVIRMIDNLAECALALAAERRHTRVDAALVHEVAAELCCGAAQAAAPAPADTSASGPERAALQADADAETAPDADAETAPDADAETAPDADAETASDADARKRTAPAGPAADLPVLTDAVDALGEVPIDDAETAPHRVSAPAEVDGGTHADAAGADPDAAAADDELDADDPQSDALEGVANAHAFEDFSNLLAEAVFGEAELDALSGTLAVPGDEPEHDGPRERTLTGT